MLNPTAYRASRKVFESNPILGNFVLSNSPQLDRQYLQVEPVRGEACQNDAATTTDLLLGAFDSSKPRRHKCGATSKRPIT